MNAKKAVLFHSLGLAIVITLGILIMFGKGRSSSFYLGDFLDINIVDAIIIFAAVFAIIIVMLHYIMKQALNAFKTLKEWQIKAYAILLLIVALIIAFMTKDLQLNLWIQLIYSYSIHTNLGFLVGLIFSLSVLYILSVLSFWVYASYLKEKSV